MATGIVCVNLLVICLVGVSTAKLACYNCNPNDGTGCEAGSCEGDYCVDTFTKPKFDDPPKYFSRSCFTVLAGRKSESYDYCQVAVLNNMFRSVCGCSNATNCAKGRMNYHAETAGNVECLRRGPEVSGTCGGDLCIWSKNGLGCINTGGEFHDRDIAWPAWDSLGCVTTAHYGEVCTCNTPFCNNVETFPANYDPDRPTVQCMQSSGGTCLGHGCYLLILASNGAPVVTQQGCRNETGNVQMDQYCFELKNGTMTERQCLCTQNMCNVNVPSAIKAVNTPPTHPKRKCFSCSSPDNAGCNTGSCTGDYCIDIYSQTYNKNPLYKRGCYGFLAGAPPMEKPGEFITGTDLGDTMTSVSACNTRDNCRNGTNQAPTRFSGDLVCLVQGTQKTGTCQGDQCIWSDKIGLGCHVKGGAFHDKHLGIVENWAEGCVNTTGDGEVCSCMKTFCNTRKPDSSPYDRWRKTIQCHDSLDPSGTCQGHGCTLRQKIIGGKTTEYKGCRTESGTNTFSEYCTRVEVDGNVEIKCLCAGANCNADLNTAIIEINNNGAATTTTTTTTPKSTTTTTPGSSKSTTTPSRGHVVNHCDTVTVSGQEFDVCSQITVTPKT